MQEAEERLGGAHGIAARQQYGWEGDQERTSANNLYSRRRHPSPRARWWTHFASLRHPASNCQEHRTSTPHHPRTYQPAVRNAVTYEPALTQFFLAADCLLPEVHRRAQQEPAEAGPRRLRPYPPRRRQQAVRAQEVRRSGCARAVPEVLQIEVGNRMSLLRLEKGGDAWLLWRFQWVCYMRVFAAT